MAEQQSVRPSAQVVGRAAGRGKILTSCAVSADVCGARIPNDVDLHCAAATRMRARQPGPYLRRYRRNYSAYPGLGCCARHRVSRWAAGLHGNHGLWVGVHVMHALTGQQGCLLSCMSCMSHGRSVFSFNSCAEAVGEVCNAGRLRAKPLCILGCEAPQWLKRRKEAMKKAKKKEWQDLT